ncbi:hypothetical protein ACFV4F_31975 [Kitasatospora sp. NPDC059722]|uniref:hypothetical protein n=1 Tax=Kitasatospora sp. NPDC059722 TaxID=3346925 RepID=UPI0036C6212A
MRTSPLRRAALTVATAVLLITGTAASASAARRDVTAEQCHEAGGHVEGVGYCTGAEGVDQWGADIDGQGINSQPNLYDR